MASVALIGPDGASRTTIARQLVSWWYQTQGYVVLYDRHFVFDFTAPGTDLDQSRNSRLHRWCLSHLCPRPNLGIFLDAPSSVLYTRKKELPPPELERHWQALFRQGRQLSNFVQVDANQPLEGMYAEAARHPASLCEKNHHRVPEREHGEWSLRKENQVA